MVLLQIIWFLLPGYVANMTPVLVKWLPILDIPVDFNKTFLNKPILGSHKTYRGLTFGISFAILVSYLEHLLYYSNTFFNKISLINYEHTNFALVGFLLGFGALFGDIVASFFKRRLDIASGKSWFPFDQLDYAVGMILFILIAYIPSPSYIFLMILISFFLHIIGSYTGYLLGLKDTKI